MYASYLLLLKICFTGLGFALARLCITSIHLKRVNIYACLKVMKKILEGCQIKNDNRITKNMVNNDVKVG